MRIEFTYNEKNFGPKVTTRGDRPLIIYLYNLESGRKVEVEYISLPADHFYIFPRQWYTQWRIEVMEWVNGKLHMVGVDEFIPTYQPTHFYLEEGTLEDNIEYTKACLDYTKKWGVNKFLIETPFYEELSKHFNLTNFTSKITDIKDCCVNYVIKKTPSAGFAFESFGVPLVNEEIIYYNHHHPVDPSSVTPYEFAKSILFGPDYKTTPKFIPYEWTLKERVVH